MNRQHLGHFFLLIALFLFLINLGISLNRYSVFKQAYVETCNSVKEKVYLPPKKVNPWYKHCTTSANKLSFWTSKQNLVFQIRQDLAMLEVSHLYLNDPIDEKYMWSGLQKETGLRAKNINGKYFIVAVKKSSPAFEKNIKFGDQLLKINNKASFSFDEIKYAKGQFEFLRKDRSFKIDLEPREVKVDEAPFFKSLKNNMGLLKITSYRSEYFEDAAWKSTLKKLPSYKSLIVDLRENLGGNFVAMLRSISPFFCKEEYLGNLGDEEPKTMGVPLENDLDDNVQYDFIQRHDRIALKSFSGYGCFRRPLYVLINENTGSVAEMFAQILRQKNRAKLFGKTTSGQVLLAVWYSMPLLGKGYTLSIPEANFFDMNEDSFEGFGIDPDLTVDYIEKEISQGKDSFFEEVFYQHLHATKK